MAHRLSTLLVVCFGLGAIAASAAQAQAQPITTAGQPAQLDVRAAGERSIRITLKPVSVKENFPVNPAIADRKYPAPALSLRELAGSRPIRKKIGALTIEVRTNPGDAAKSPSDRGANPPDAGSNAGGEAQNPPDARATAGNKAQNPPDTGATAGNKAQNPPDTGTTAGNKTQNPPDTGATAGNKAQNPPDTGSGGTAPTERERPPSSGEGGSGGMGKTLTVRVSNEAGRLIQEITFEEDGHLSFTLDDQPVLGLGEGGPQPEKGKPWREDPVQFDRRGQLDTMQPRWQAGMYGSRNPVAMMVGTSGWGLFVAAPWGQVDLRKADRGVFLPWRPSDADRVPQNQRNQQQALAKGLPPPDATIPGVYDLFIFDASDPAHAMKDFSVITGPAAMPPLWALGYMQSHRTLEDDSQLLGIADTFRKKQIPLDALIYLGTGFTPRGWNTKQPSFDFNPEVFKQRDGPGVVSDLHAKNIKVVVHMVPWDRDKLPTLHGSIPARPGEELDASHIANYWRQHVPLVNAGIDAFWPDEGDWFNLHERIKRHQLYYQGHLSTTPNVRPWSLQRNGYPGIAQWGGWVWSGDTDSSWKTLEAQIAVGLNYSLSIGPYWGSDIGGFYANNELTGELYARWFQFAAFCGSFRSHGRTWWTRLPWGWGLDDMGPREYNNTNTPIPADDRRNILQSEMNNPAIEPVVKKYAELRYQLLPYTYTLAREARDSGLPLMRAMWLHHPDDVRARGLGDQFLWGRDLLVAPVYTKGATSREVYLPKGDWYDWWTNEKAAAATERGGGRTVTRQVDLGVMPLYVRAGAIIPVDPVRQYTAQPISEPTTLKIFGGADGSFTQYADDGISQEYLDGRGTWIKMTWNDRTKRLTLEPGAPKDATNVATKRTFRALLVPSGASKDINYEGKRIEVRF